MQLFISLLALIHLVVPSFSAEYRIRPSTSAICPNTTRPCLALGEYVRDKDSYFTPDSTFTLLEGEHHLNTSLLFYNVANITLSGEGKAMIIVSAESYVMWLNSTQITLKSLEITYRGREGTTETSALRFENSHSIEIANLKLARLNSGNSSRALSFIESSADITNCSFSNGRSQNGGAVYINSSTVTFSGENLFTNNTAEVAGGAVYGCKSTLIFNDRNTYQENRCRSFFTSDRSGGGAVFISESLLEFNGFSAFRKNGPIDENTYLAGGAFKVINNSTLNIRDKAIFVENSASYSGAINCHNSTLLLEGHVTFRENRFGGVISLFMCDLTCIGEMNFTNNEIATAEGFGTAIFSGNSTVLLSGKLKFKNNRATRGVGGAIYAFNSTMRCQGDVEFANNVAKGAVGGAVFLDRTVLECKGNISFISNTAQYRGGGVYAIDSTVRISNRSSFTGNRAIEGAGMGFEGSSQLVLQSPVHIDFYRNMAESIGGGILVLDSSAIAQCQNITVDKKNCFFKIDTQNTSSMDVHLNFTQNSANSTGSVLYGGSLQLCRVQVDDIQIETDSFQFLQTISTVNTGKVSSAYISSDPLKVCYCQNGLADCSEEGIKNISVKRGELFPLSVITVGQGDMPVPSTLLAYIQNNDNTTELIPQGYNIKSTCTGIGFRIFTVLEDTDETLILYPDGPCGNTENTRRMIHVILEPCPAGFSLKGTHCVCEDRLLELNRDNKCDVDTALIERPGNSWTKAIWNENESYNGFILHPNCPFSYCKEEHENTMISFSSNASDDQCDSNRSGILCGACKESHSLTLTNFHCKVCGNENISLVLFFIFAGIALIVFLFWLHMTVAAGTINGLILYANIVNVNSVIFFPHDSGNLLTVFIAWINLDFGIETCFYDGLDFYSYAWLEYAFPLYLWFLMGVIVFSNKISGKIGKLFGSNPVAVLATVILLSYTKLLQTSIIALSYTYLEYPDGTYKRVWLYDANITYFEGKHIILSIVAFCVIFLLILPYFLLLMFGYRLQAYSGNRAFHWLNKFKPLLDAYYAPYHKQTRYWTGFMLLVRGCLYLTFAFQALENESSNLVAISTVFTIIAIIPWLSSRIYDKLYIDVLEASFLLNICILATATYHVNSINGNQSVVTYLSVGIAFMEFLGIVCFHICLRVRNTKLWQDIRSGECIENTITKLKKITIKRATEKRQPLVKQTSLVTTSVVELREPLLEDI